MYSLYHADCGDELLVCAPGANAGQHVNATAMKRKYVESTLTVKRGPNRASATIYVFGMKWARRGAKIFLHEVDL